jgi:DNA-binding SARP family transcriptional activator
LVTIRLLGPPAIERDDVPVRPPRGRKSWALLAYLLLAERPPSRRQLAELLYADAEDPLGALRWTLAELRRVLGRPDLFTGDPVGTALDDGITVDLHLVTRDAADPAHLLTGGGELLDGLQLPTSLEFESWLLVARHRVSALIEARLRQAALGLLAAGRAVEAVPYASQVVARNPLDEGNHELLVRSLATAGDGDAARRQIAVCEDLLRRELGVDASPALREAATVAAGSSMSMPLGGRAAAVSQLDAGRAAIIAGAIDAGLQSLRRAVVEAARCHDHELRGRALAALGGALVHAARGRDEEGAVVLYEAIEAANRAGDRATAVTAHRELGYIEVQAGRRQTADRWLSAAQAMAVTDAELAAIHGVRGMSASDRADYPAALRHLDESIERAAKADDQRQQAWSLGMLARLHVLRAEQSQAASALTRSLDLIAQQRWMAFLPLPQSLQAEVELLRGDLDGAADRLEQAWVLACQLDDPCWQGIAGRGLGILHAERGDHEAATRWLGEATAQCTRVSDRYQWVHAYVIDAATTVALRQGSEDRARPLVATLAALGARCDMREMVVRAQVHQARLGNPTAVGSARILAKEIDNPVLPDLIAAASASG